MTKKIPIVVPEPSLSPSPRLRSLDGLRGIAALIVVVHHSMIMTVAFAATYYDDALPTAGSLMWWLTSTPLKIFTAGGEAVTVFFIMSGFVLTVPLLRSANYDWWNYYPRRMLRLGLPVAAAVAFAALLVLLVPQDTDSDFSFWVNRHAVSQITPGIAVRALDLFAGDPIINNPLWSLKWEVIFSLLLPVFVLGALAARRFLAVAILVAGGTVAIGLYVHDDALTFLPTFLGGVVVAVGYEYLSARAVLFNSRRFAVLGWIAFTALSACLLVSYWLLRGTIVREEITTAMSFFGAVGIVAAAIWWPAMARFLQLPPVRWLGRISFSLYLVHVPIEMTLLQFVTPEYWYIAAIGTVVLALICAALFERFVEAPALRLSKRVGAWSSRAAAQLPTSL